jgi:Family of unknown function (DUF6159)
MTNQPMFAAPPPSRPATGKQLLQASWALLKQDRELLWLPAIAAISGLIAAAVLFVPGFAIGYAIGSRSGTWGAWVGGFFAAYAASVVAVYFQAALVIGANERADGRTPQLGEVLRAAWQLRGRIFSWALLTTSVGLAIRAVEDRLGPVLGTIIGFLGGIAWAIASFLVVPVLVAEGLGPIEAVKRSADLIRQTWGSSLRTTLRFGLVQLVLFLPVLAVFIVGIVAVASGAAAGIAFGIVLIVISVAAFLALCMVFSAIASYTRALIYRYATGRPVPGIDPQLFAGVFRAKGRGRLA